MHISRSSIVAILAFGSSVSAAPANVCNPVDAVYAVLKGPLKAKASSLSLFSWWRQDRPGNAGRTVTATLPDQTQVTTAEVTNVNYVTRTDITYAPDQTQTVYVTITAGTRTVYQRRGEAVNIVKERGVPPELALFASQRISSACSCIVTPTTRTITATQVKSVAGPDATATQQGRTIQVTVVVTRQTTVQAVITETLPPTASPVQTIQTTLTPILVKPKICNGRGLPSANAFNYDANFNTNQAACIASCKTDNRCLATGFYLVTDPSTGSSTGTCRKYDKSVTDSADLGPG